MNTITLIYVVERPPRGKRTKTKKKIFILSPFIVSTATSLYFTEDIKKINNVTTFREKRIKTNILFYFYKSLK